MVAFLLDEGETRCFVNAPGGDEHVVGPEHHAPVPSLSREPHTLLDERPADAKPASPRLDQQATKLRGIRVIGVLNKKHAPRALAPGFGDPAMLSSRVMIFEERAQDPGDEPLEF